MPWVDVRDPFTTLRPAQVGGRPAPAGLAPARQRPCRTSMTTCTSLTDVRREHELDGREHHHDVEVVTEQRAAKRATAVTAFISCVTHSAHLAMRARRR